MNRLTNDKYIIKLFLIILLCFVIDSTLSYFLPYNYIKSSITLSPYIGLMMFSMVIKTIETPERYFFAAVCGVYYSVVYANTLAIYILIYCFIAFARTYIYKFERLSFFEMLFFCIITIFAQEVIVYWLMKATGITMLKFTSFILMRVLPTLVMNIFFYIFVYLAFNTFVRGD